MNRLTSALAIIAGFALVVMAGDVVRDGERYLLAGQPGVVIAVETGWEREGIVPVVLDVGGVPLRLGMRADGRVFAERFPTIHGEDDPTTSGRELFRIDRQTGRVYSASADLHGDVYERNELRTRMRFPNVEVAFLIAAEGRRISVDIGGIEIPVRAHLEKGADGALQLVMEEIGPGGPERLILDSSRRIVHRRDGVRGKGPVVR